MWGDPVAPDTLYRARERKGWGDNERGARRKEGGERACVANADLRWPENPRGFPSCDTSV